MCAFFLKATEFVAICHTAIDNWYGNQEREAAEAGEKSKGSEWPGEVVRARRPSSAARSLPPCLSCAQGPDGNSSRPHDFLVNTWVTESPTTTSVAKMVSFWWFQHVVPWNEQKWSANETCGFPVSFSSHGTSHRLASCFPSGPWGQLFISLLLLFPPDVSFLSFISLLTSLSSSVSLLTMASVLVSIAVQKGTRGGGWKKVRKRVRCLALSNDSGL